MHQPVLRIPRHQLATYVDPITKGLPDKARKSVGVWLMGMAGMTFGAILLGGVTR